MRERGDAEVISHTTKLDCQLHVHTSAVNTTDATSGRGTVTCTARSRVGSSASKQLSLKGDALTHSLTRTHSLTLHSLTH